MEECIQTIIVSSTMLVKFVAHYEATIRAFKVKNFVSRLYVLDPISYPIKIYYDNFNDVLFPKIVRGSVLKAYYDLSIWY